MARALSFFAFTRKTSAAGGTEPTPPRGNSFHRTHVLVLSGTATPQPPNHSGGYCDVGSSTARYIFPSAPITDELRLQTFGGRSNHVTVTTIVIRSPFATFEEGGPLKENSSLSVQGFPSQFYALKFSHYIPPSGHWYPLIRFPIFRYPLR